MFQSSRNIIDPHLHLFNLQDGDYDWLKPTKPPFWQDKTHINRQFHESDITLEPPLKMCGFVHIEAGFDNTLPWREIDWLERHCQLPFSSVGNADLSSNSFTAQLEKLCLRPSVVGIRHILDEQASNLLCNSKVLRHLTLLSKHQLSFDAQLSLSDSQAVEGLINLVDSTPELKVIINHAGWPPSFTDRNAWQCWQNNLLKLVSFPQIAIKLSGWEMSNRTWEPKAIKPIIDTCLTEFNDTRLMLASNFPLCTWRFSIQEMWQGYTTDLNLAENTLTRLTYSNAANWYKLDIAC